MRILVFSHNVFSHTSNMGKTLLAYFSGDDDLEVAQFYVHSEIPTDSFCKNYFRITDKEMIKSVFTRKSGTVFGENDIAKHLSNSRTDSGFTAKLYQKARKRTPLTYLLRNFWWDLGAWNTRKLAKWLDDFDPDVVFLASGDYAFIYKIALKIARMRSIPLVVSCMDDYYFYNKNAGRFLGNFAHSRFMKQVNKTMQYASCIFSICDKMSVEYGAYFNKTCYTLHTPSTISAPLNGNKTCAISYIGNMGYGRNKQLVALGRAIQEISCDNKPEYIDVYSAETRPEILADLVEENGIKFHGAIPASEVLNVMANSMAVIHTESFDKNIRQQVRYSVSTKIADSLASGACILAYGPAEVASIDYLQKNGAAYCITNSNDLSNKLKEFFENSLLRERIVDNALELAERNHNPKDNSRMIKETLEGICNL